MVASDKTGNKTLKDLINDSVKGTVGTSTTEEALTVKDVKPPKAKFEADKDTEVTVTVGSDKYNDVTLKFYVRLGTTNTTTAYKAHKVEFEIKAGTGANDSSVAAKYGNPTANTNITKSGLLIPENSKIQFAVTKGTGKTVKAWVFTDGYTTTDAATAETVNITQSLTKDIKATVELQ